MEVQSLILAVVAALLLFAGINGFRKGVASQVPGGSIPNSTNTPLFRVGVPLQLILGGMALAGAIALYLHKTPPPVDEEMDERPRTREKRTLARTVRDPIPKNKAPDSKDDLWRKALIGTWRLPLDDNAAGEITYSSTGGMSGSITLEVAGKKREILWSGKWDVKDGRLCEEIEESDTPDILPVGRKTKDKIIEVKEKEFRIIDAELGATVTSRRIE